MKKTKRNVAVIVVLLFVCAAVYFNWSYNAQWGSADAEMAAAEDAAMAAANADGEAAAASASSDDYFAKARLTRQQSRDEALSLLKSHRPPKMPRRRRSTAPCAPSPPWRVTP